MGVRVKKTAKNCEKLMGFLQKLMPFLKKLAKIARFLATFSSSCTLS
jgi:hypothetical protein